MMAYLTQDELDGMKDTVQDVQLAYVCRIERKQGSEVDPYGNEMPPSWGVYHDNLKCWYWIEPTQDAVAEQPTRMGWPDIALDKVNLVLPAGTDVTEEDRILEVTDLDGNVITGPMNIKEVRKRPYHTHLVLHEVR